MANPEHLKLVQAGANATWNLHGERLDLSDADLSGARLNGAMLDRADLRGARLIATDLSGSRLQEANLSGAQLIRAVLNDARLGGSSLAGALLCSASLRRSTLVRCDLTNANLAGADLEAANLSYARVAGAMLDRTKLVDVDFEGVIGLGDVIHDGPSELGTHALLRYGHEMTPSFLRGVGLPDSFIRYLPSIISSAKPVDFYSTYICAAPVDAELARRLQNDLQNAGVRCWFRHPRSETGLDEIVRLHDQSIVLYSAHGRADSSVQAELDPGRQAWKRQVIVLQLDETDRPLPASVVKVDFRNWQDFRAYSMAFDELAKVLLDHNCR